MEFIACYVERFTVCDAYRYFVGQAYSYCMTSKSRSRTDYLIPTDTNC